MDTGSLARTIGQHWPVDNVALGSLLQDSGSRVTRLIHGDQGAFVVKVYEAGSALGLVAPSTAVIDRQLSVLDHLAGNGFDHAPRLLPTRDGQRFVEANGRIVSVQHQVDGGPPPDSPATWVEFGRIAARLNADTSYPHPYAIPIAGTIAELTERAASYPFRERFLELVAGLAVLEGQPPGLIHTEINCANAIQEPGGRLVVVDWDQAGTGPWVLEAGYPLLTWFVTEDLVVHWDAARAFYRGYTNGAGLAGETREMVFTAALLHALRYLDVVNRDRRWKRIAFALAQREALLATMGPS